MKPNNIITLTVFLTALKQLDEPLPENIQTQLNDISKGLITDPDSIGNLDTIAESYPPLDKIYQIEFARIEENSSECNRGGSPLPLPTEQTAELTNAVFNVFSNNNSVAAAKIAVKPNLLQRVWDFINGRIENE
ncbi:hypothetical protein HUN01_11910 [Nostoc edaphicum CCNP1411]|uniref:Uncharacterized protein n=1 Tax=Nostoc edaphicum CCNP1411 TaxID=1472755 RepID=A0A7D7QJC8_9NOSO|nr:hypothetical protein [Nostoc edaphicum]QMS88264.1 hypothetical protein HUN01_11910 [Nostoc edaphicum CCNP1411]